MNLAIDIGNTTIKFGLFDNQELVEVCTGESALTTILSKYVITHAIVSKTGANNEIEGLLKARSNIQFFAFSNDLKMPLQNLYLTPHTLGADRLAGAVAANFRFPSQAVLKIDFGTCITFDLVNAQNQYLGGAISPGIQMRLKALHNYTAKLPLLDLENYTTYPLIGTDTATSILSGVVNGIKEEVDGIIKQYIARFVELKVVVTGGNAPLFVTLLKSEIFAHPNLVLEGLNRVINYNIK